MSRRAFRSIRLTGGATLFLTAALLVGAAPPAWAKAAKPPKCGKMSFPASGQTTAYTADKNNGVGADTVPDDGTVEAGATLSYVDNGDGTVTDLNTGLQWEKKVTGSSCLHCVDDTYRWSGDGSQETIWDWLGDVNTEGGTGFAGHSDWRIPNVKELQSIVIYEVNSPAIDPVFGDTGYDHWSSSTIAGGTTNAWSVSLGDGGVFGDDKTVSHVVRAVRGGCL